MTRQTHATQKIALLATGDEISNGDIVNSNTREIAKKLFDLGMPIGMHAITSDNTGEIETAILFLLKNHDALIITGGLGPTSDDLTRYALSNACHRPLVFDTATWEMIVARLKRFGYPEPPQSNRQQALFPENATIIENPNGTAAGCMLEHEGKTIFMLPGPPAECLPMVDQVVIPTLTTKHFTKTFFHQSWLLFGVSEGQIAEVLDEIAKPFDCMTGYRLAYPYLEFKIYSENKTDFLKLCHLIEPNVAPHLISDGIQTASEALKTYLTNGQPSIQICDRATGGLLESTLKTPLNHQHLNFTHDTNITADVPTFLITGLAEFWQQKLDCTLTEIEIDYFFQNVHEKIKRNVPFRGERVKRYAVEWTCYIIKKMLNR